MIAMEKAFQVPLVVFFIFYNVLVPAIHGCFPSCPTTNPQDDSQLNTGQMDIIFDPATQMKIQRLQSLSIVELKRETVPIVKFTSEQKQMVSREYPEYFRRCKSVKANGTRLNDNITCTPSLPILHKEKRPTNSGLGNFSLTHVRGKRSTAPTCDLTDISVCTPVQSYVDAVFAHDHKGNLVQLFQPGGDEYQITIEETCEPIVSLFPTSTSCCERSRTVPAVVVSLQGPNIANIHVIEIQVACCTARVIPLI